MKRRIERIVVEEKSFCDECGKEVPVESKWSFDAVGKHFCSEDCAFVAFKKSLGSKASKKAKVIVAASTIQPMVEYTEPIEMEEVELNKEMRRIKDVANVDAGKIEERVEEPRLSRSGPNPLPYIIVVSICMVMLIFLVRILLKWW